MKAILTSGIVLGLLMTFVNTEVAAQRETEVSNAAQEAKNIEICTRNSLVAEALKE